MAKDDSNRGVKATQISLDIIDIVQERNGAQISDFVKELDIAKSTIYNHLSTLLHNQYLAKSGDIYHLNMHLMNLGKDAKYSKNGIKIVEKKVYELSIETNLLVDFTVENNGRIIRVFSDSNDPAHHVDDPSHKVGSYYLMHNNANGKAILAQFSKEYVEVIIEKWGLPKTTENTITDKDSLFDELDLVRNRGFAVNDQENQYGMRAVGAPILVGMEQVFGSISIGGPAYKVTTDSLRDEISSVLINEISDLEEELKSDYRNLTV